MTMKTWAIAAALVTFTPALSLAQTFPFPPVQEKICEPDAASGQRIVSKKKLARYMLQRYPFNVSAIPDAIPSDLKDLDLPRRILADKEICPEKSLCSNADKNAVKSSRGEMALVLANSSPGLQASKAGIDPNDYFKGSDNENAIICLADNGVPIEAPGAVFQKIPTPTTPLRIRGKVNDLYIDRAVEKDFQTASGVAVNYASDSVAKKDVETLQAAVGYRFTSELGGNGEYLDIIPYGQVNRILVKPDRNSSVKTSLNETFSLGAATNFYLMGKIKESWFGHMVSLRPDYLFDTQDGSRILSINTQYTPIKNGLINDFIRLTPSGDDRVWFKPIFDLRANIGRYTDRGTGQGAADHDDFVRLGPNFGLSFIGDFPEFPFSFTTSYVKLFDVAGDTDVGYFSNRFEYFLHPKKYFSLSLTHSNGNREDTAKRESLWMAGLNAKF